MHKREIRETADGSHTIYIPGMDECYHSTHGAIRESLHVFIDAGIRYFLDNHSRQGLRIFELGFGTGLNAMLSALFADGNDIDIYFETVEAFPLSDEEVGALNYPQLLQEQSAQYLFHDIHSCPWQEAIKVSDRFSIRKVPSKIQDYQPNDEFHICFFDAFAPSKQPEMWDMSVLEKVRGLLQSGGIIVTYCAKGQLKRDLKQLGFEVQTIAGAPGKKEMVRAIKN